jgi:hypothetical protein
LLQSRNNVRACFSDIDPACFIQIDVDRSTPFGRDVDAPLETFISPPIEHHEKVVIGEQVAELNGRATVLDIASMNPVLSVPDVVKFSLAVWGEIHRYDWEAEIPKSDWKGDEYQEDPAPIPPTGFICIHVI